DARVAVPAADLESPMPDLTKFNTLTFDCYGTLIDWERGILAELRPWVDRNGRRDLDDNAILEVFGTTEATCEAETPGKLYPDILAEAHRRLADQWGIKAGAADATEFGQSVGRWPAFADSATSLQYLKRYYKLVILSNVDRASFARSNEKLGVAFDRIITAQDVGSYKPSLRNFEYALADLERTFATRKADILHTAQSIFHDVVPARTVGLATMWINRRKTVGGWGATPAPQAKGALTTPDMEVGSMADFVVLHQAHLRGESA
ncbi:MAG: haloacid dehalogenase type II, partial [Reyranella sp.]